MSVEAPLEQVGTTRRDAKPRLLCVRPKPSVTIAPMLVELGGEWVAALRYNAEVEVAQGDFDLAAVCDTFRPDLIIFETIEYARPWLGSIGTPDTHPEIPRVLLLNCDPHNPLRPLTYGLCRSLRIEAIFQFGVEQSQLMLELRSQNCFSLPLFIDPEVFVANDCEKIFPVTIFAADFIPSFYEWRARVVAELPHHIPAFLLPHPGYGAEHDSPFTVRGADYAHVLSKSHFAIADTTRLDYVVRKHLEIPAAGAVLIAPESDALADYGFRDGHNCILGSGQDLVHKIRLVMHEPDRYAAMRAAGTALVHTRYTRRAWTGLIEWLACRQRLRPGLAIRQDGPLGSFHLDGVDASSPAGVPERDSEVTAILRRCRDTILHGGDTQGAAKDLQDIGGWLAHMSEPWLLLGVLALQHGQIQDAVTCIARRPNAFQAFGPWHQRTDPVETAWLLVAAHLLGRSDLVQRMRQSAAGVDHLCLRRVDWLLAPTGHPGEGLEHRYPDDDLSIHWLGQEPLPVFCALAERIWNVNHHPLPRHLVDRLDLDRCRSDAIA